MGRIYDRHKNFIRLKWDASFAKQIMDVLFVESRYAKTIKIPRSFIEKLPDHVTLFTTVQFLDSLESIQSQLEHSGITVDIITSRRTGREGQILGCSTTNKLSDDAVYIGDGEFHPKALLIRNDITVHAYDPISGQQRTFTQEDIASIRKRLNGMYAKFLSSPTIGIMVSTKYGQNKRKFVDILKKEFPDKSWYVLADDTFDFSSLKDFSFLDMFVNTSCERIGLDDMTSREIPLINAEDLLDMARGKFDRT